MENEEKSRKKILSEKTFDFGKNYEEGSSVDLNAHTLNKELAWLKYVIDLRIRQLEENEENASVNDLPPPPESDDNNSSYMKLVQQYKLSVTERLLLISAVAPHISPFIFTESFTDEKNSSKLKYPKTGGFIDRAVFTFVPTMQTVLFLATGNNGPETGRQQLFFKRESALFREQIISLGAVSTVEVQSNQLNAIVDVEPEYVEYILSGQLPRPDFGRAFPATLCTTDMEWSDLVVNQRTMDEIKEVLNWVGNAAGLNQRKKIKPGYPCLFYGPPGTGKTLTAQLIGKTYGRDVFRIDLSMVVSKYIGETEKNLAHLFDRAQNKNCILFFDEADSLFTKRTGVSNANDKWANLEVSYLLQRMESYPGLTILATNLRENLDTAMTRRFQAMIFFGRPKEQERLLLWEKALPEGFEYEKDLAKEKLATYDLTGANIANVLKFCASESMARNENTISKKDLYRGIQRELMKEGKTP